LFDRSQPVAGWRRRVECDRARGGGDTLDEAEWANLSPLLLTAVAQRGDQLLLPCQEREGGAAAAPPVPVLAAAAR
jgi:hypothetical protein